MDIPLLSKLSSIKLSFFQKVVILILLVIVMSILGNYYQSKEEDAVQEHFADATGHVIADDDIERTTHSSPYEIYDKFYSKAYDTLFRSELREQYEIYNIEHYTIKSPTHKIPSHLKIKTDQIRFLDVGCGTGHYINFLQKKGYIADGADVSQDMLNRAKTNVPAMRGKWIQADVTQDSDAVSLFTPSTYSHILCMFFTIYYINDVGTLFDRVHDSLRPGGYFCVHLVHKQQFDPVLEKSSKLIPMFNPQRHTKDRVTKTKLKFKDFDYIADWTIPANSIHVKFREKFLLHRPQRRIRVNEHELYMRNIAYYTQMAKSKGFAVVKVVELLPANHAHNYIYIFQKTSM
jgi:SAM-dependent methyltransferase